MDGGEEQGSAFLCIRHKGEMLVCASAHVCVNTTPWGLGVFPQLRCSLVKKEIRARQRPALVLLLLWGFVQQPLFTVLE